MPILSNFPVGKTGSQYYGTCSTAAGTAAKVVTLSDKSFALKAGVNVRIKFTAGNSATSPTLNVNGTGAKSIKIYGTTAVTGWNNNVILDFTYDGTYWMLQNASLATTGTYGITKLESSVNSTSNSLAATPSAVKQAYDKATAADNKASSIPKMFYGDITSEATSNAVTATVDSSFVLEKNAAVTIFFTHGTLFTSNDITLNINDTGAKPLILAPLGSSDFTPNALSLGINASAVCTFVFDGTNWVMGNNTGLADKYHYGTTRLSSSTSSTDERSAATPKAVKEVMDTANAALPKAGGTMTGNLVLNADPTADLGAATKKYVDDTVAGASGNCKIYYAKDTNSNAMTFNRSATVDGDGDFELVNGVTVFIRCTSDYRSTSALTYNINNTGAYPVRYGTNNSISSYTWRSGAVISLTFDGQFWVMNNINIADTQYYGMTKLNNSVSSTSTTQAATANAVKQAFDYADEAYTLADQAAPMCFNNVTVAYTSGVSDNTYPDYPIRYDVTCNGLTTNYSADVRFGMTEVISGNFAPICDTATNIVKIFAKTAITADITIPTIVCTKVVYE